MTSTDFIKRVQIAVYESSIRDTISLLEKPPGRRPSSNLVALSKWYNELPARDKEAVRSAIKLAARSAVFSMLTVLDGMTSIRKEGEKRGFLELRYTEGAESAVLNDPNGELLHDIFAGRVPPT